MGVGDGVGADGVGVTPPPPLGVDGAGAAPPPPYVGVDGVDGLAILLVERLVVPLGGASSMKLWGREVCLSPTIFLPLCTWKGP